MESVLYTDLDILSSATTTRGLEIIHIVTGSNRPGHGSHALEQDSRRWHARHGEVRDHAAHGSSTNHHTSITFIYPHADADDADTDADDVIAGASATAASTFFPLDLGGQEPPRRRV